MEPIRQKSHHDTFAIDHVMVMDTKTLRVPMHACLASQIPNSYDSFVVRAPKITLLSTKTASNNAHTSTPVTQHPQISCRDRHEMLTNGNKPRDSWEEAIDCGDCKDCKALRRVPTTAAYPPQPRESTQDSTGQDGSQRLLCQPNRPRLFLDSLSRDQDVAFPVVQARSRRLPPLSASNAAARQAFASRASGWGLVGWGQYRIPYSGMLGATSGAKLVAQRRSSM